MFLIFNAVHGVCSWWRVVPNQIREHKISTTTESIVIINSIFLQSKHVEKMRTKVNPVKVIFNGQPTMSFDKYSLIDKRNRMKPEGPDKREVRPIRQSREHEQDET